MSKLQTLHHQQLRNVWGSEELPSGGGDLIDNAPSQQKDKHEVYQPGQRTVPRVFGKSALHQIYCLSVHHTPWLDDALSTELGLL